MEVTLALADHYPNFSICGLSGETPDWRDLALCDGPRRPSRHAAPKTRCGPQNEDPRPGSALKIGSLDQSIHRRNAADNRSAKITSTKVTDSSNCAGGLAPRALRLSRANGRGRGQPALAHRQPSLTLAQIRGDAVGPFLALDRATGKVAAATLTRWSQAVLATYLRKFGAELLGTGPLFWTRGGRPVSRDGGHRAIGRGSRRRQAHPAPALHQKFPQPGFPRGPRARLR